LKKTVILLLSSLTTILVAEFGYCMYYSRLAGDASDIGSMRSRLSDKTQKCTLAVTPQSC
jgi:hypothetical protein